MSGYTNQHGVGLAAHRGARLLVLIAALGIGVRLVIAVLSYGTNDAATFWDFAVHIDEYGLLATYDDIEGFNHPPLIGYWILAAKELTPPSSPERFPLVFKLPFIAADALGAWLLWRIGLRRSGALLGGVMAALYAWSPVAMLISGYHCNTDNLYAVLCLLAVYLMGIEGISESGAGDEFGWSPRVRSADWRFFLGGLALGAAINVKLIPVLLIAPLMLSCPNRRLFVRFSLGLMVAAVPFIPPLILVSDSFLHNVLGYRSQTVRWGIAFLVIEAQSERPLRSEAVAFWRFYRAVAPWLIILLPLALGMVNRMRPKLDRAALCAVCFAIFLVLAPGFGVQYLVVLVPLLLAASVRFSLVYGALAGTFLLLTYICYSIDYAPRGMVTWMFTEEPNRQPLRIATEMGLLHSHFHGVLPRAPALIGLVAWVLLGQWAARQCFLRRKPEIHPSLPAGLQEPSPKAAKPARPCAKLPGAAR